MSDPETKPAPPPHSKECEDASRDYGHALAQLEAAKRAAKDAEESLRRAASVCPCCIAANVEPPKESR